MTETSASSGVLYLVATPIGNLQDMTLRAIQILQTVDHILAEDTRHTQQLLQHFGLHKTLLAFHAHNEGHKSTAILKGLQAGQSYALVTDAGTPLISDPGYPLVHAARLAGITVSPIPGACALIAALSAAGIPCEPFSFFGFLPAKPKARQDKLHALKALEHSLVFYESPHRLAGCLADISHIFGQECGLVLAKELTKTFETFMTGTVADVQSWLAADPVHGKGEFVLIIPPRHTPESLAEPERILALLLAELPLKQAVKLASSISGAPKNLMYSAALARLSQYQ